MRTLNGRAGRWLAVAAALALVSCEPGRPDSTVSAAKARGPRSQHRLGADANGWLTPGQAQQFLREHPDAQLLCVASHEDYRQGHLPGSILIPVMALRMVIDDNTIYPQINHGRTPARDRPLLIYCSWTACKCPSVPSYSELARKILREQGFTNVYSIEGGMRAWIAAHLPYEKGPVPASVSPPVRVEPPATTPTPAEPGRGS